MRKVTVLAVVLMVALAGCSTGGDGGGETSPESTATEDMTEAGGMTDDGESGDGTDSNGGSDDQAASGIGLEDAFSSQESAFSGSVELDMTIINGSEESTLVWRNDTERQFVTLTRPSGSTDVYYLTESGSAYRNSSTGETRYGSGDGRIATEAGFTAFFALAGFAYIGVMDWEQARTTTVDGEQAVVFEADSINQSAIEDSNFEMQGEIQSATGQMTVTADGISSASVRITVPRGEVGTDLTITRGGITVEQPDWVDESQFGG